MTSNHHDIDINPIPDDKAPIFINEPWLIDQYTLDCDTGNKEPDPELDNIRIYVPLDLNASTIINRLSYIINKYGEANEENEIDFSQDVRGLIYQIEIYDQITATRSIPKAGKHSEAAKEIVREFIELLEDIPDGCAEIFPFEMIEELREEYLLD